MTGLWTSEFGDSYTRRQVANPSARLALWSALLPAGCRSVLEAGAGTGQNLEAMSELGVGTFYAAEPNELARTHLFESGLFLEGNLRADFADSLGFPDGVADLVLTCGVLIHVPPDRLIASMREIHRCAKRWIICGEYFAPSEEMIPYRGTKDTLWRRDYGSLWLDNFSDLHMRQEPLFMWKRTTGLDNITFWSFEKGPKRH